MMAKAQDVWTVIRLLQWSTDYLKSKGIDNARLNVERMLCNVLNLDRIHLYLHFDRPLTKTELQAFKALLLRRARNEPLQYILEEIEFYSLPIKVGPGVLIPRPETEVLVERAISVARSFPPPLRLLDVGTGSGAIAIALAKHLPEARISAIDISDAALKLARENARRNDVASRIELRKLDILSPLPVGWPPQRFHMVVSNPPYVAPEEKETLAPEIVEFEPHEALFCQQPLQFYERLAGLAPRLLEPEGWLICEIAPHRAGAVRELFVRHGFHEVEVFPDLAGKARVIQGRMSSKRKGGDNNESEHLS